MARTMGGKLVISACFVALLAYALSALHAATCPYTKCFYKACIRNDSGQCRVFNLNCEFNPGYYPSHLGCSEQNWNTQNATLQETDFWDLNSPNDTCTAQCSCESYPIEANGCQVPARDPDGLKFCQRCSNESQPGGP